MIKNFLRSWSWWEITWLTVFSGVAIALSLLWGDTLFSFSVFLTGVICVVLVAKGSIWNYAWGTYNVGGYAWLSYQNGFYGELTLNAGFFLPMQLIGWLMWKNKMNGAEVEMKRQNWKQMVLWLSGAAILTAAYGYFLSTLPGQNSPYLDASSTVLSVLAMILMARRYAEQWIYWIIIDVVTIIMWVLRLESGVEGAPAMIVMWSAYLVNAVYGYIKWLQHSNRESSACVV